MNKLTIKTLEKNHTLKEVISLYFDATKSKARTETIQKWINVILCWEDQSEVDNDKWASKIKNGEWITNKYGAKLYYKLGN